MGLACGISCVEKPHAGGGIEAEEAREEGECANGGCGILTFTINRGTQYEPQNAIVLRMRTPKKVPLNWGTPLCV